MTIHISDKDNLYIALYMAMRLWLWLWVGWLSYTLVFVHILRIGFSTLDLVFEAL